MDLTLIISAALMGLAGTPHCAAMCGPACGAMGLSGGAAGWPRSVMFHLGRLLSYATVGALGAAGVSVLGALGASQPMIRPLWSLVHAAGLGLGLWLLITGRQPAWVERIGRGLARAPQKGVQGSQGVITWHSKVKPLGSSLGVGAVWAAWPCGLLQSAFVVAALGNGPVAGASIMIAFGLTSALGLVAAPAIWLRLARVGGPALTASAQTRWAVRAAGLMLAAASAWALGHDLWMRVSDYCATL